MEAERFLGEMRDRAPRVFLAMDTSLTQCPPGTLGHVLPQLIRELEQG